MNKIIFLIVTTFLSITVNTAYAADPFEERVLSPTTDYYQQQMVVLSNTKVKLALRPLNFDFNGKKWNYKVDWEVQNVAVQTGSMCINGNKFIKDFTSTTDSFVSAGYKWTGHTLKPKSKYKITIYSKPNCSGKLLLNKTFTVLAQPK